MRAIVNTSAGCVELKEWEKSKPGTGQVRIHTRYCGVCATDLLMIAGWNRTGYPSIPGHEWSGVVDSIGSGVDKGLIGKRCVAYNVLSDGGEVGFEHPGGYGEYLITEAINIQVLPDDFPLDLAVLIEPLAVCVRAFNRLRIENRESAFIFGDGPIGLLMLFILKKEGVKDIFLVGGRNQRLQCALGLGAKGVINYHDFSGNLLQEIIRLCGKRNLNLIEASGSKSAIKACIEVPVVESKVLLVGDYALDQADFQWQNLLHREIELIFCNASSGGWIRATNLAIEGKSSLEKLITTKLPVESFKQALELTRTSKDQLKVVMEW